MDLRAKEPRYGNWVSDRLIGKIFGLFLVSGVILIVLLVFVQNWIPLKIMFSLISAFFLLSTIYFVGARRLFSKGGGDIQNRVLDLLVSQIDWNGKGKALDIGCGSGALTIKLAKKYDEASITGIDYWGRD